MGFEELMNKKVSRKKFLKGLSFFVLAAIIFPKNALSKLSEEYESKKDLEDKLVPGKEWVVDGVSVMRVTRD